MWPINLVRARFYARLSSKSHRDVFLIEKVSVDFLGRVVFVTSASSGLGAQFARCLAQAGVVLASQRLDRFKQLCAQTEKEKKRKRRERAGGNAYVMECDVTDHSLIKAAVAHAETEMDSIDILVNNPSVSVSRHLQGVSQQDFDFTFGTNVRGAFFVAHEVTHRMIARARGRPRVAMWADASSDASSICQCSGFVVGLRVWPKMGVYYMSKAAVVCMSETTTLKRGQFGINVNVI